MISNKKGLFGSEMADAKTGKKILVRVIKPDNTKEKWLSD